MVITWAPERPRGSEFDTKVPTMSPEALHTQGAPTLIEMDSFYGFWGGPKRD